VLRGSVHSPPGPPSQPGRRAKHVAAAACDCALCCSPSQAQALRSRSAARDVGDGMGAAWLPALTQQALTATVSWHCHCCRARAPPSTASCQPSAHGPACIRLRPAVQHHALPASRQAKVCTSRCALPDTRPDVVPRPALKLSRMKLGQSCNQPCCQPRQPPGPDWWPRQQLAHRRGQHPPEALQQPPALVALGPLAHPLLHSSPANAVPLKPSEIGIDPCQRRAAILGYQQMWRPLLHQVQQGGW
jgi:hypothetical protein